MTTLDEVAVAMHEMFMSYVRAGFTREEALRIVIATVTGQKHGGGEDAAT